MHAAPTVHLFVVTPIVTTEKQYNKSPNARCFLV